MKSFLLIGIAGVYNYGCEAIVRGSESIIRKEFPDAKIYYASFRPDADRSALKNCRIEIVKRHAPSKFSVYRLRKKICSMFNYVYPAHFDDLKSLNGIDAVISIGGDLYTLLPNGTYDSNLISFGDAVIHKGIPYILWGASVGPFAANKKAEAVFKKHLSRIPLITAREKGTIDYLNSIGIGKNVVRVSDPAFIVDQHIVKEDGGKANTIAINLSFLSLLHAGLTLNEGIVLHGKMIKTIIETLNVRIVLVPHVIPPLSSNDDDRNYLEKVYNALDHAVKDKVTLITDTLGFTGTKKVLIACDLVIAARMHCAINAVSSYVPTLFLSYSQKSSGMCQHIYGHRKWSINISDFSNAMAFEVINEMLNQHSDIHSYLKKRIPEIRRDAYQAGVFLKQVSTGIYV
ncbi:MAG: polysaccharide pyruvyl transferase family protein [Chitinivibrionales bacterium]|nr:polysaccharide pyruvyl transferase family protein [Chitinivibrionales bacterium]